MPIEILELVCSKKPFKRFHIKVREGDKIKKFDFGLKDGETFIDHGDTAKRDAYWKRHCGNAKEERLINNLIPSASLFSARILFLAFCSCCFNLVKSLYNSGLYFILTN
jgi:hypothetical protein